jgi:tetratricopeptide (TPR) repeat protein
MTKHTIDEEEIMFPKIAGEKLLGKEMEPLCLLVGAGISQKEVPGTEDIVCALLKGLLGNQTYRMLEKEKLDENRRLREKGIKSPKDLGLWLSEWVRFEYLLQLIRDYCDGNLTFMKKLYTNKGTPNEHYHCNLANLLNQQGKHVIFTTNFDTLIERAYAMITNKSLEDVHFKKDDLIMMYNCNLLHGLIKLHGSIDLIDTLGVTFEGIVPGKLEYLETDSEAKAGLLSRGLKREALCVIGYSGSDTWDVIPTIESTKAWDKPIYWFKYAKNTPKVYKFKGVPNKYHKSKEYRLLRRLVDNGLRDPEKTLFITGPTERTFARFLISKGYGVYKHPTNRRSNGSHTDHFNKSILLKSVSDWKGGFRKSMHVGRLLAAINLCYVVGTVKMTNRLSKELAGIQHNVGSLQRITVLPKLAMCEYNRERPEKAIQLATQGIKLALNRMKNLCTKERHLLHEALLDSYGWKAESERYMGNVEGSTATLAELETVVDKIERMKGPGWSRRLLRFKGDMLAIKGEKNLNEGHFEEARRNYEEAERKYRNAAEMNYVVYSILGLADTAKARGDFLEAENSYARVTEEAGNVGWRTWINDWVSIAGWDIARVKKATPRTALKNKILKAHIAKLDQIVPLDPSQKTVVDALRLEFTWTETRNMDDRRKITQHYGEMRKSQKKKDPDFFYRMGISYADFLKCTGKISLAREVAVESIEYFERNSQKHLAAHSRTVLMDIDRLKGCMVGWRKQVEEYKMLGCKIGELYASIIGKLSGELVKRNSSSLINYAEAMGLSWARIFLSEKRNEVVSFPFPGSLYS